MDAHRGLKSHGILREIEIRSKPGGRALNDRVLV
jgi:hypothetical protein